MDDIKSRIPTIPPTYRFAKYKAQQAISKPLLKAIIDRIKSRKDLYDSILSLWPDDEMLQSECLEKLARIVARTLIDFETIKSAKLEKDRAEELSKKTKRRWEGRALERKVRSHQLRKFSKVVHRKMMARYNLDLILKKPARHDRRIYRRCLVFLYDFFACNSSVPYKYIAALIGLFNLHPRAFCTGCPNLPLQRKSSYTKKNQSLAQSVRRGINMCKLESIFGCPKRYAITLKWRQ